MTAPLRILSLGAGVQSTTVLLMALAGEIEPIDAAIFADTGWEPAAVYTHLERLEAHSIAAGVPVHRVTAGNIREDHADPQGAHLFIRTPRTRADYLGRARAFMPFFIHYPIGGPFDLKGVQAMHLGDVEEVEGPTRAGKTGRKCTATYKIEPVERKIRDLLGLVPRQRWPLEHSVTQVFGISWDETQRMRDSSRPAVRNDYPLVDRRMTRSDCHGWLADHGWDAPRSACIGCPFHRNDEWRNIRDNAPEEWADAVDFDRQFRARQEAGLVAMDGKPFLHDSRVPLDEALIDEVDDGQLSLFGNECEGFCGV
jgi:hypothetical protein